MSKEMSNPQNMMGQKRTSAKDQQTKYCYICQSSEDFLLECTSCGRYCDSVCAWLENEETLSPEDSTNWRCPDCKNGTQASADVNVDSSSVISFEYNDPNDSTYKVSTQTSDNATKKSETASKSGTTPKRRRGSSKHPSPPQVVIDSPKKESASDSPSKRRKKSSKLSQKQKEQQHSATQTDIPDEMQLSTFEHRSDDLASAVKTLQAHLDTLHILRTRNSELDEEVKVLKEKANAQEETIWQLKEYNENLEGQVGDLKDERADLRDKLQKIRRLSGVDILEIET